ncbi:MAG TPA: hypothetical protein VM493_00010 [Vicinamibacterales bacterium]|nr:hypothetical protein [Vicinamibacterales bacterium]
MAEDPLHDIIESIRTRLRTELETQIQAVSERHEQALEEQRNRIESEAEQLWAPQLQAARAEVEHQAAAAAAARAALDDLQQLLDKERSLSESRLEYRPASGLPGAAPDVSMLVDRLRTIDAANSVTASLSAIARAVSFDASRASLYLANGTRLEQVDGDGAASGGSSYDLDAPGDSIAIDAFRRGEAVGRNGSAYAVPVVLDGTPIGVLYGEMDPAAAAPAGWAETLETIARHGAARLGYLTALRTAQARHWLAESPAGAAASGENGNQSDDATASARRYARLVVSEIKLYNESAVEEGRSRHDLLARLAPEIDRARRLYEERVPLSVPGRSEYFQQELIQTLAGGDPSQLG